METSNLWAKLEEEDQEIEDKIVDLDDPRRPVDLRQYQQLNNMQDASMAQLEGPKSALWVLLKYVKCGHYTTVGLKKTAHCEVCWLSFVADVTIAAWYTLVI